MILFLFTASIFLGLIAGLLAGLFGIGGGLVIVPVLTFLFNGYFPQEHILLFAIATSLATIIFTAIASVITHHRLGAVSWVMVRRLSPLIVLGSVLGAIIAEHLPTMLLRYILVVFLCYVGVRMALAIKPSASTNKPSAWLDYGTALLIGLLSAIVGIGGGTLTVPYLVQRHYRMQSAVAIASACGLPIAVASTISYLLLGWHQHYEWSIAYISLPAFAGITLGSVITAPLGAKLAHRLPAEQLKRYFSLLLFLMAIKLLWHS